MPTACTVLASIHFSTLDYLLLLAGFLDLVVAPCSLILLLLAMAMRRGRRTSLRVLAVINIVLGTLNVTFSHGSDQVYGLQVVLWSAVLVALAIPRIATKLFGAPFDPDADEQTPA